LRGWSRCWVAGLFAGWCVGAGAQGASLIPLPHEAHWAGARLAEAHTAVVLVPGNDEEDQQAAVELTEAMHAEGMQVPVEAGAPELRVRLLREGTAEATAALAQAKLQFSPAMQAEGYVLLVGEASGTETVTVVGGSAAGVFYGVATLRQLLAASVCGDGVCLPQGAVRDWPAMRYRAIQDDLSRGPVPTLKFQEEQIRTFAAYKANIYSPYYEQTLAYARDPLAAPPGGALSRAEAEELARYGRRYHVLVLPEQESFGHLHNVLKYEQYAELAETPHGAVLAPGQSGTQPLIRSWFTQITEDFPGPFLHIGADETFDLGTGRTQAEVAKRGLGPVYAAFLTQIHATLAPLGKRLLFWGDIAESDPKAIPGIPKDMIAIPWIYWHKDSYDDDILPFKNAGLETWVAPGDANWSVLYPLGDTALDNIQGFVEAGQRLGSTGVFTAVWDDDGEGLFNQDWFGVLFGAAAGWQTGRSDTAAYTAAFGPSFFGDTTGRVNEAQKELVASEQFLDVSDKTFWIDPWSAAGQVLAAKERPHLREARLHAERAIALLVDVQRESPALRHADVLAAMELGARRIDFAAMKFQFSDEMAAAYAEAYARRADGDHMTATRHILEQIEGNNGRCADLRNGYAALKDAYRAAWMRENRPYWLGNVMVRYDRAIALWDQRAEQMGQITDTWGETKTLPTAQEIGMPLPGK
jgi:hexosaminidase